MRKAVTTTSTAPSSLRRVNYTIFCGHFVAVSACQRIAVAAMSTPDDNPEEKRRPHLIREPRVILPPDNFGIVEPGLYRSSLPQALNFSHLRGLHLRSVVVLSEERPTRTAQNFFEAQGITVFHTGANAWVRSGSWKPISDEVVKDSLQIVLCRDNLPALVCDVGGLHLVGMLVGCLRRLQHWNVNSAVDEYRAYAGSKTRYNNEQFIELYDVDLVTIPDRPPLWFAEQVRREKEERHEFRELAEQGLLNEEGTLRIGQGKRVIRCFIIVRLSA